MVVTQVNTYSREDVRDTGDTAYQGIEDRTESVSDANRYPGPA